MARAPVRLLNSPSPFKTLCHPAKCNAIVYTRAATANKAAALARTNHWAAEHAPNSVGIMYG